MAVITGHARSGTKEWVFQRIANLSIVLYSVVLIASVLMMEEASFAAWQGVFGALWFKVYSTVTLFLVSLNSVLAGWQIGTDYVKVAAINRVYILICFVGTLAYLLVGNYILWLI